MQPVSSDPLNLLYFCILWGLSYQQQEKKKGRQDCSFHLIIRKDNLTARIVQSRLFKCISVPVRKHKQSQCRAEPSEESEEYTDSWGRHHLLASALCVFHGNRYVWVQLQQRGTEPELDALSLERNFWPRLILRCTASRQDLACIQLACSTGKKDTKTFWPIHKEALTFKGIIFKIAASLYKHL